MISRIISNKSFIQEERDFLMRLFAMLLFSVMIVLSGCSGASSGEETGSTNEENADDSSQETTEASESETNDEESDGDATNTEEENDEEDGTFEQKEPEYEMNENYYIEPIDDADPKVVLLTIDDAPDGNALEMAETLNEMDAPAIFYVNKIFTDQDDGEEVLGKIHEMGFPIGNHTNTHPNLSDLTEEEQEEELVPVYDQIEDITGESVKFFRAPHGVNTDYSDNMADERDVLVMNWSYGYDFKEGYQDADKLIDIMLEPDPPALLRDGANLLMHDRDWTNEALEDIVQGLRDQGYTILDPALLKTPQSPTPAE